MILSFTHSNTTIILTSNPILKDLKDTYMENTVFQFPMAHTHQKKRIKKGRREGVRKERRQAGMEGGEEAKKENY